RLYLRGLARESRGERGRIAFFAGCLAVGVAAVVAVAGLSASLDAGIRGEARQLLAADLAVEANRPLPDGLRERLAAVGADATAEVREMVTVVAAPPVDGRPGPSQLVEVKAVEPGYPFYGRLALEPDRPLADLLDARSTVVAPDLLARLGLAVGDPLAIGGQPFTVAGTVAAEPDRVGLGLAMGPRVFLSLDGLDRAGLIQRGSRVEYRLLARLAPEAAGPEGLDAATAALARELPPEVDVETWRDAQPGRRRQVRRVERFLGLVALLSLLVGGVGVAQTVRAWLAGRLDAIAVLRCLGMRPREVAALYLGQTALLGLAGSLAGMLAGIGLVVALPRMFPELVPARLVDPVQPWALLRGLGLGIGVALLFGIPPLAAVRRVPPVRVLRRNAEPLPAARWAWLATAAAVAGGVFALAAFQSRSLELGGRFTLGLALATAALALAGRALVAVARRLPELLRRLPGLAGRRGLALRQGVAGLARPGAGTLSALVALGLGTLVVLAMALVELHLTDALDADLPEDAPTAFLVDVQPHQWAGVREMLEAAGGEDVTSVPVVMARIAAIDGVPAAELAEPRPRAPQAAAGGQGGGGGGSSNQRPDRPEDRAPDRWALTREQRLTYLAADELPDDNQLVAGALWQDPRPEVSVEDDFARDLGVGLGTRLTFDVQGVPIDLWVTSLRRVDWGTFGINFFLVVEPGVLDDAPQQRLATARLPAGSEQGLQDAIAARYPNVTLLRLREILEKIVAVLERIGLAVSLLGGFTVVAGVAILGGAVSAAAARRGREVALLKTLGFTRGMELDWSWHPLPFAVAFLGTALLATAAGLAASGRALARKPVE
ncbi:MAG TPA: FtsX-like permease family protein, partial [Thermoanaerobaculia bacterium]